MEKLIIGQDGVARGAVIRLSSARGPVTLRRPLQLLYPLKMSAQGSASSVVTQKLITEQDGVAQGAVVRLSSARGPVTLRRPLQLLYPLKISAQGSASSVVTHDVAEPVDAEDSSMEQNRRGQLRKAASLAREIRFCLN